MTLITREGKGSKLTIQEMDGNLEYLESQSLSGRTQWGLDGDNKIRPKDGKLVDASYIDSVYNSASPRGFFDPSTGSPTNYSAYTTSAYTVSCNFIADFSEFVSGNTIEIQQDVCSPSSGEPEVNQYISINFEPSFGCGNIIGTPQVLFYKIQSVSGSGPYTLTLDRDVPDLVTLGCNGSARVCIYPSGMIPFYYSEVPSEYFCSDCNEGPYTSIWNMNIPWSESPAGVFPTINEDYTKYGSVGYLGTKEYLGYQTNSGQIFQNYDGVTGITDTFYYNSFNERVDVLPSEQKAIAIVHYTNTSVVNYYGEKFAFEPYDPASPLTPSPLNDLSRINPFNSSNSTSRVLSTPCLNSSTLPALISKPVTGYFCEKATANGSPTYPNPITAMWGLFCIVQNS
jgi:hypothetical protein